MLKDAKMQYMQDKYSNKKEKKNMKVKHATIDLERQKNTVRGT
jgi:hypothetical protein